MNYDVFYSEKAREDLADIYAYIAFHLKGPMVAKRLYENIVSAIHTLEGVVAKCTDRTKQL